MKKKLSLDNLSVSSFVTVNSEEHKTIKGGAITDYVSLLPGLGGLCMIQATAEIAAETAQITNTIIRSHQQMDCAGATRMIMGCTKAGELCGYAE